MKTGASPENARTIAGEIEKNVKDGAST